VDDFIRKLLDETEAVQTGRTPSASELGEMIMERGLEDAGDMVSVASGEQLAAVLDEDVWTASAPGEAEQFDDERFALWIQVLAELDPAAAASKLAAMDEDLIAYGLARLLRVFDLNQVALAGWTAFLNQDLEDVLAETLSVNIDRWLILSRGHEGWTEILAVLFALDDADGDLFARLMVRCEEATNSAIIETERQAHAALSVAEEVAEDAAAGRDQRRTAAGYVRPTDAVAFLRLAKLEDVGDDAITRAHLGQLVEVSARPETGALADNQLKSALAALTDDLKLARQRELAFLANVLVSAGDEGRALRPAEAAELAFEVCALGWTLGGGDLASTGLVRLFGRGWRARRSPP